MPSTFLKKIEDFQKHLFTLKEDFDDSFLSNEHHYLNKDIFLFSNALIALFEIRKRKDGKPSLALKALLFIFRILAKNIIKKNKQNN